MTTETTPESIDTDINPNRATYEPESNKLRLYVGRVPREEYLKLKAEGWTALHKQREAGGGDFAATWTPERRDTALRYADIIEDEDMSVTERAADRAERFSGYRDKRTDEATGHADRYDRGPQVHGYQSQARAERAAKRHDRIADRAGDAWDKAEYWQRRTAGVIRHALHKSTPGVRMGRIKELEAAIRKCEKELEDRRRNWRNWQKLAAITDPESQTEQVRHYVGYSNQWSNYMHPRAADHPREYYRTNKLSLYSLMTDEHRPITGAEACALFLSNHSEPEPDTAWIRHYKLRLAYENQMLEAQGGRAAFVEMEVGGWIGNHQIRKVNKSNATGRVVSVTLKIPGDRWGNSREGFHMRAFNIERLSTDAYRPPTAEDKASLGAEKKKEKAAAPKKDPCPLINPTDEDAERLQALWNERAKARHEAKNNYKSESARAMHSAQFKPTTVTRIKQATYSANSKGACSRTETRSLHRDAQLNERYSDMWSSDRDNRDAARGAKVCMIRIATTGGGYYAPESVVVLTDKPQKPFPAVVWDDPKPAIKAILLEHFDQLESAMRKRTKADMDEEEQALFQSAIEVRFAYSSAVYQFGYTEAGHAWANAIRESRKTELVPA